MGKLKRIYVPGSSFIPKTSKTGTVPPDKKVEYLKWTSPRAGETLYEIDIKAHKIREAEIAKITLALPHIKGLVLPKLVVKKEGAIYIAAKDREDLATKLIDRGIIKIHNNGETGENKEAVLPKGEKA